MYTSGHATNISGPDRAFVIEDNIHRGKGNIVVQAHVALESRI